MFYDHKILTSRKHGVATVWLMATLGSKSALRKVTRKAILDVDVPKTCATIVDPNAPMALRLQGSLLYGVSRVYSQQCGYILSDTQAIRDKLHGTYSIITARDIGLDANAGKARSDQINIPDDPTLLPDFALDFDLMVLDNLPEFSQSGLISLPSFRSSQSTKGTAPALELGSASTPSGLGGYVGFGGESSSAQGGSRGAQISLLHDDTLLDFPPACAGNYRDGFEDEGMLGPRSLFQVEVNEAGSGVAVHGLEEAGATEDPIQRGLTDIDDYFLVMGDDEPLPVVETARAIQDDHDSITRPPQSSSAPVIEETSSTAEAPQRRKHTVPGMQIDSRQELANDTLKAWGRDYLINMANAAQSRLQHQIVWVAKRNAAFFVHGQGIGGVGAGLGQDKICGPLSMFSGQELLGALLGPPVNGRKRFSSASPEENNERRVRSRSGEDQVGRLEAGALADDSGIMALGDDDIEIGRDAPPALPDLHSSQMPWNMSTSRYGSAGQGRLGSTLATHRRTSSVIGPDLSLGPNPFLPSRRTSRMLSSSPLRGKGASLGGISALQMPSHEDHPSNGSLNDFSAGFNSPSQEQEQDEGFPRLPVDSQAVLAALDDESHNFLAFVAADIASTTRPVQPGSSSSEEEEIPKQTTTFTTLLPPISHSKEVAAQAFLHVLSLATKGLVQVRQETGYGDVEIQIMS